MLSDRYQFRQLWREDPLSDIAQAFLAESRRLLTADYLPKIERCLKDLRDEDVWWRPNESSNSIGNLVLHLCGNLNQWIIGGVGEREYVRNRQHEFDERTPIASRELVAIIRSVVGKADEIIGSVDPEALLSRRRIQDHDVNVLQAIYHAVEHFGMHTGQIIVLIKMRDDRDLNLRGRQNSTSR